MPDGYVSVPQVVEFPCPLGTAFGYYYPPANAECVSSESAPPLLVKAHGGPTGATSNGFNPSIQYFTSRGFAVLDVDYGRSPAPSSLTCTLTLIRGRAHEPWTLTTHPDPDHAP